MNDLKCLFVLIVFGFFSFISTVEADKLLMVHAIWRHGDRTPTGTFPNDPNKDHWTEGFGELTSIGAAQHRELGKWLRNRYVYFFNLLPKTFNSKYISIQSTNYNRTIKSAQNNFIGMYNITPTLKIVDEPEDWLLNFAGLCNRTNQLREMIKAAPSYTNYETSKQTLFDNLTQLTGRTETFPSTSSLNDVLFIEDLKKLPIDPELRKLMPQIDDVAAQYSLNLYGYLTGNYKGQNFRVEVPRSLGGYFLKTILARMSKKVKGQEELRYVAYSAHDVNIMGILSTFGFKYYDYNRNERPGYASVLLFELWQSSCENTPYLRIIYHRDPKHTYDLSSKVEGCRKKCGCTLDEFIERCKPYSFGSRDAFCNTTPLGYSTI